MFTSRPATPAEVADSLGRAILTSLNADGVRITSLDTRQISGNNTQASQAVHHLTAVVTVGADQEYALYASWDVTAQLRKVEDPEGDEYQVADLAD